MDTQLLILYFIQYFYFLIVCKIGLLEEKNVISLHLLVLHIMFGLLMVYRRMFVLSIPRTETEIKIKLEF